MDSLGTIKIFKDLSDFTLVDLRSELLGAICLLFKHGSIMLVDDFKSNNGDEPFKQMFEIARENDVRMIISEVKQHDNNFSQSSLGGKSMGAILELPSGATLKILLL